MRKVFNILMPLVMLIIGTEKVFADIVVPKDSVFYEEPSKLPIVIIIGIAIVVVVLLLTVLRKK